MAMHRDRYGLPLSTTAADAAEHYVEGFDRLLAYRNGVRPDPVATDERLGRRYQAQILFDAIEKVSGLGESEDRL